MGVIMKELKKLEQKALQEKLIEAGRELVRLRKRHAAEPLKNPMELRKARKQVARIKTILHQKNAS